MKIPSHPYVLVNRSILCNCGIEADNHHLLESLAACDKKHTKLTMYFTINLAFTNYLDLMPNLVEELTLNRDKTNYKQPLLVYLNISYFDNSLSNRPDKLKDFVHNYIQSTNNKEIFELQKKAYYIYIITLQKILSQQNCKYLYIYLFHNLNNHNNTSYLPVL